MDSMKNIYIYNIETKEIINQINNIKRDEIVRPAILLDNKKQNLNTKYFFEI